jgi:putative N-acetylmannosamine-6-phosphate epimerase
MNYLQIGSVIIETEKQNLFQENPTEEARVLGCDAVVVGRVVTDVSKNCSAFTFRVKLHADDEDIKKPL